MKELSAALDRDKRFEAEIKAADPAMRAQLLGAWKEALLERVVTVLKATGDPKRLVFLDKNLAVLEELIATDPARPPK